MQAENSDVSPAASVVVAVIDLPPSSASLIVALKFAVP